MNRRSRLFFLAAFLAFWPLWRPMYSRWFSTGGWIAGAILFLTATLLGWRRIHRAQIKGSAPSLDRYWLIGAAAFTLLYAITLFRTPFLINASAALMAWGCLMQSMLPANIRARAWGVFGLLICSLHLTPSLDFFLGYPLRILTAHIAAYCLGQHIQVEGTGLTNGLQTVFVDAPCSGLRMLMTACVLASALAVLLKLTKGRCLLLLILAWLLTILGNATRAIILFTADPLTLPASLHTAIGLTVFFSCAIILVWGARQLKHHDPTTTACMEHPKHPASSSLQLSMSLLLVATAAWGFTAPAPAKVTHAAAWPDLPNTWNGIPLQEVALSPETKTFITTFPGIMRQYTLGNTSAQVLMRCCAEPTRMLHPAEDCYRGTGWQCTPLPSFRDDNGITWGQFSAKRATGEAYIVKQCYFLLPQTSNLADLNDLLRQSANWPDASSWYWATARINGAKGITLAITVSSPSTEP